MYLANISYVSVWLRKKKKSPCIVMLLILITHGMQRLEQELGFGFVL